MLVKWVNYHLAKSGTTRRLNNISSDVKDSEIYVHLMHSVYDSSLDLLKEKVFILDFFGFKKFGVWRKTVHKKFTGPCILSLGVF